MTIDALWLRALQNVSGRAAHEIKGAMNGVAVNIEVVRSRAERGDAVVGDVLRYASSAADQLGGLIAMTEALLGLARAGREPADVAQVLRQLVAVLGPAERTAGRAVELRGAYKESLLTSAPASAVRLVTATALLVACEGGETVTCEVQPPPELRVRFAPVTIEGSAICEALDAVAGSGIAAKTDGHGISIMFPPEGR